MRQGHPEICLWQPEIPQNTGNIARLAAATGCRLHLVLPLGFSTDDKNLRRPGLDYWPYLDLEVHKDPQSLLSRFVPGQVAFFSARAEAPYTAMPESVRLLVFGCETRGLPPELRANDPDAFYRIPIFHDKVRSLNLANAAAIVSYHVLSLRSPHWA